ncbi:MAG: hypothetical protein LC769_03030 [Chloroflexi bacterium]|nr:hypothetical protein [Chloroflexota bacterium]
MATGNYPRLLYSIDNQALVQTLIPVGSGASATLALTGISGSGAHTLQFWAQGFNAQANSDRWNGPSNAVRITSITLANSYASVAPSGVIALAPKRMLVFGDSITEGLSTGYSAQSTAFGNAYDATLTYVVPLAAALDAEYGPVGYLAQGPSTTASSATFYVPPVTTAYQYYHGTASRLVAGLFSPTPDYVVSVHGRNTTVQADMQTFITNLVAACPTSTKILIVPTFDGTNAATVIAAYNAYLTANPSVGNVFLLDLTTITPSGYAFVSGGATTQDSPHPNAQQHARLAAMLTRLAQSKIDPVPLISRPVART